MRFISVFLFFLASVLLAQAQQRSDQEFSTNVDDPYFEAVNGPVVAIDQGHHNFHTVDGRFQPFAELLRSDGYQVNGISDLLSDTLDQVHILVISNPLHASNIGKWQNPCPSAYTEAEIKRIKKWVGKGGRLLLIADHMPFGGAANDLAQAFGFGFANGFAMSRERQQPPDRFLRSDGTLHPHPVTQHPTRIDTLAAFTGSAVRASKKAAIVAHFPESHHLLLPEIAWQFDENTKQEKLDNYVLAASLPFGKGKVFLCSEAAMFTAQVSGDRDYRMGMNSPLAPQNKAFVRNVLYWLSE